jgi:hypothetical protein
MSKLTDDIAYRVAVKMWNKKVRHADKPPLEQFEVMLKVCRAEIRKLAGPVERIVRRRDKGGGAFFCRGELEGLRRGLGLEKVAPPPQSG